MLSSPVPAPAELATPYSVNADQIARFRRDGFIKLKHVLSAELLAHYSREITNQVGLRSKETLPLAERTAYGKAFLQVMNLWTHSQVVQEFVFSPRLARIAAELMGVRGVRLYHDQALYKEPGGGLTPMHVDQYYWPLAGDAVCTVWIPLQATPPELGPLSFRAGSQRFKHGRELAISEESERQLQAAFKVSDHPLVEEPYELGEVSFHYGWTFHRAGPNNSDHPRAVMTVIYMDADMRVAVPANPHQESDLSVWLPGLKPGDHAASPLNPVLYPVDPAARPGTAAR
ncbi:MAG: phytanoyl-CoA dioxygenase family protein [Verrucomicrobiota bacterium]